MPHPYKSCTLFAIERLCIIHVKIRNEKKKKKKLCTELKIYQLIRYSATTKSDFSATLHEKTFQNNDFCFFFFFENQQFLQLDIYAFYMSKKKNHIKCPSVLVLKKPLLLRPSSIQEMDVTTIHQRFVCHKLTCLKKVC